jgi:hypothetical protein
MSRATHRNRFEITENSFLIDGMEKSLPCGEIHYYCILNLLRKEGIVPNVAGALMLRVIPKVVGRK